MRRIAGLAAVALLLLGATGCAAFKPRAVAPGPGATVLAGGPVRSVGVQSCGAGSLSVVLNYHGDPVAFEELETTLPRRANGGVLTLDMVLAARERGFDARLVEGSPELVTEELVAGRPVILMLQVLDSPGGRGDLFHYVVLDGLDPARGLVRLQWGDERPVWTSFEKLERPWGLTRRATLLIAPGSGDEGREPTEVRYAVGLESAGRTEEAAALYRRLVEQEPESALLWTNLGNAESRRGRVVDAERAYRRALELAPQDADALNNLAWLLYERGDALGEAEELARRAVAGAGADAYLALDTLGRIQRAAGRCGEALESLLAADRAMPAEATGRDALALEVGLAERDCGDGGWRERLHRLAESAADPAVASAAREALGEALATPAAPP